MPALIDEMKIRRFARGTQRNYIGAIGRFARFPADVRASVFGALRSPTGTASLLAATKGVSARLLGKADLLDLPLQLPA